MWSGVSQTRPDIHKLSRVSVRIERSRATLNGNRTQAGYEPNSTTVVTYSIQLMKVQVSVSAPLVTLLLHLPMRWLSSSSQRERPPISRRPPYVS
jgi:hypothetical protein